MKKLIFVIGASGSGKTSTIKKIQQEFPNTYAYCYFDHLGVPSESEVKEKYGDWDNWQKMRTDEWIKKIKESYLEKTNVIFDAGTRPSNIEESCKAFEIINYSVILLDCSDEVRKERLIKRGHAKLVNDTLPAWCKYLRDESMKRGYTIIDTSELNMQESIVILQEKIDKLLYL